MALPDGRVVIRQDERVEKQTQPFSGYRDAVASTSGRTRQGSAYAHATLESPRGSPMLSRKAEASARRTVCWSERGLGNASKGLAYRELHGSTNFPEESRLRWTTSTIASVFNGP